MASFSFELVAPDKQMYKGEAESVLVPGSEGDFVVLKDHAAVMTSLRPGVVAVDEGAGKKHRFFVRGGFADVSASGLILLAETAIPAQELTGDWLSKQIEDAEEDLADADEAGKVTAQEKLDRLKEIKGSMSL
jgi:F-type H+-transporting ATPase subunit epsilon